VTGGRPALVTALVQVARRAAEAGAKTSLAAWQRRAELAVRTKADADDLVTEADLETQRAVFAALSTLRPDDGLRGEESTDEPAVAPAGGSGVDWWVDPIDGTTSFVYGRADWSVSVAAVERDSGLVLAAAVAEPVLGWTTVAGLGAGAWRGQVRLAARRPDGLARALVDVNLGTRAQRACAGKMVGRLAARARDVRRGGSAALALTAVADGRADAAWVPGIQPWDGLAGVLLAREAGATVGDLSGDSRARRAEGGEGVRWPATGDVLAAAGALFDELRAVLAPVYRQ
jgi:myo-inositol-1(or 4)-monophosphatase